MAAAWCGAMLLLLGVAAADLSDEAALVQLTQCRGSMGMQVLAEEARDLGTVRGKEDTTGDNDKYFWPTGRGRVGSYTSSPYSAPKDLSAPTWSWHHPAGKWSTIPVGTNIDDKKNIYLAAGDGIRKFSQDGELLWMYRRSNNEEEVSDAASIMDGMLYDITTHGRVFAISMETGKEIWSRKVASSSDGNNAQVSAHAGVVITGAEPVDLIRGKKGCCGMANHVVLGINATDGSAMWRFEPEVPVWNYMASFADDGTFIFQDLEGRAYRNRLSDGKNIWKSGGIEGTWTDGQALMGPNNIVYAVSTFKMGGDTPGSLTAYSLSDGKQIWRQEVPKPPNNHPAIGRLAGGTGLSVVQPIGAQCEQGKALDVYTFDAETGALQWIFNGPTQKTKMVAGDEEGVQERLKHKMRPITLPNPWSSASIDGDGTVYIGSETGQFYALRNLNGDAVVAGDEEVSTFETGAAFVGSSGPALAPGMVAVGSISSLHVWQLPEAK